MQDRPSKRIVPAWRAMLADTWQLAGSVVRSGDPEVASRLPSHADAMADDVLVLAEAVFQTGDRVARLVPGYSLAARQLRNTEAALLKQVKQRMDDAAKSELGGRARDGRGGKGGPNGRAGKGGPDPRARLLQELLRASLDADAGRSRENLHLRILRSMVPEEARILAALADGTRYPLMHVETRGPGPARVLLANASTVGRVAGVHLSSAVPMYVTHMRLLGLAEEGPLDPRLSDQYLLLSSEGYVRRADSEAEGSSRLGARTIRRTLRISSLGAELWAACRPDEKITSTGTGATQPETYRSAYAGPLPVVSSTAPGTSP